MESTHFQYGIPGNLLKTEEPSDSDPQCLYNLVHDNQNRYLVYYYNLHYGMLRNHWQSMHVLHLKQNNHHGYQNWQASNLVLLYDKIRIPSGSLKLYDLD